MDERQQQIRERAGLEESRLNTELIDFLRSWSTPVLLVIAAVAAGYVLYQRWDQSKLAEVNQAFVELDAAVSTGNPSPEALRQLAEQYDGIRGVPILARLEAADAYLEAVRTGLRPGAVVGPDGKVQNEQDQLGDADREQYLKEAESLYRQALADAERMPNGSIHQMSALYGLAAVAESRGDLDGAKGHYERVKTVAEAAGFPLQVKLAQQRIDTLPQISTEPVLVAEAQLPRLPWVPEPAPAPALESASDGNSAPPEASEPAEPAPEDGAPAGEAPAEENPPAAPAPEPAPSDPK